MQQSEQGKLTMTFRNKASEEAKASNENNSGREELEQIDVDMGETPFVKFTPTTMVTGTFPENEGNPIIRFPDSDNNDGRKDQGYLGFVMDDVSTYQSEEEGTDGTIILYNPDDSTDYRVFNKDDSQTKHVEGMGVKFGDRLYEGEVVDSIDERAIVVVSGAASTSVARKLDKKGAVTAGMNEDPDSDRQTNGGLIEYNPNDEGPSSRYARNPELKSDLYGKSVGLMVTRREEIDEDYAEQVEAGNRRSMYWFSVFNMETEEPIEPTEDEEPLGYTYLEWNYNPDATGGGENYLSDDEYEFVRQYQDSDLDTDEATIRETIKERASVFDGEPNTDAIVARLTE